MHLCKCNGVADLKYATPNMCSHAEFGRSAVKSVVINIGELQNLEERWNSTLLGWEAWLTDPTLHAPPDVCYHVNIGTSATKGVRINIRIPKIGQRWDPAPLRWGRDWPPKNKLPPICVTTRNFVVLRQRLYAQIEGNPKIGERWDSAFFGWGLGWPLKTSPLSICVTTSNLVVLRQRVWA